MILASELKTLAFAHDLNLLAVFSRADAEMHLASEIDNLTLWQKSGFAGEMHFMQRPVSLFTELDHFLPGLQSVILFSVPYASGRSIEPTPAGFGRVARYAWGRDYHRVIKQRLKRFSRAVSESLGVTPNQRAFSDAVPILERVLARHSAQGFIGKNTLFIRHGSGSYQFLAEILWDLPVEDDLPLPELKSHCGSCSNCLNSCPTGAFVQPRVLDARRCISYLTIEKQGQFSDWERNALGEWIFGCDVCQDVCPFNHNDGAEGDEDFQAVRGAGQFLKLSGLLQIRTQEEFASRFAGTPLMRAGRESMIRNACAVIGNTRFTASISDLIITAQNDTSELARHSARTCLEDLRPFAEGQDLRRILHFQ